MPARMVPRYAARNSARLAERIAMRSPRRYRTRDLDALALIDGGGAEGPPPSISASASRSRVRYRRGERIAILSANRAEFLAAYLGTMRAGMVSVPLSFKFPPETIDYVLRDAGAACVFVDHE